MTGAEPEGRVVNLLRSHGDPRSSLNCRPVGMDGRAIYHVYCTV